MFINDIDVNSLNIFLLNKNISNAEIITFDEWLDGSLAPIKGKQIVKWTMITANFFIDEENDDEAEKAASQLLQLGKQGVLEFRNLTRTYKGTIASHSKKRENKGQYTMTVQWKCQLGYGNEQIITVANNDIINLPSTADTPVKIIINPTSNINELEIKGFGEDITIKNLVKDYEVIIDGELGLVTEEGQNKWNDYDSWGFPKLSPGENEISINPDIEITAIYSPRWL